MKAPAKRTPTPVEDVEMEDASTEPVTPERTSRKRRAPPDYRDAPRKRQRYDVEDPTDWRGRKTRELSELMGQLDKTETYARRQKTKKSTIKRQALIMARALGESERNVKTLVSYVNKLNRRM